MYTQIFLFGALAVIFCVETLHILNMIQTLNYNFLHLFI